jgi:hypothetical protein
MIYFRRQKKNGITTGRWKCNYYAVGYGAAFASVIGYGSTPEEAMQMSKLRMSILQKNYNKISSKK